MLWQANPDEETTDWRAVRENRTHGSEGGEDERPFLPLSGRAFMRSILNIDPSDRITHWIPAFARMTGLVGYRCALCD